MAAFDLDEWNTNVVKNKVSKFQCLEEKVSLRGMKCVSVIENGSKIEFTNPNDESDKIICSSLHVSCQSDRIPKDSLENVSMFGMILYRYNGRIDWHLNGVHCKCGYVLIKKNENIKELETKYGTGHSKMWKYLFGSDMAAAEHGEIVGAGFAIYKGEIKFNSGTFNNNGTKDVFHDGKKAMHSIEQRAIKAAIDKWRFKRQQNILVQDMNMCTTCRDFV